MPFQNKLGSSSNCVCGLVFELKDNEISSADGCIPVPLKSVHIDAKVVDFISKINVTQTYVNLESHPIEAIYVFPVEEEAAVISFEAEVNNRKISTQIKEKQQARNDYDDAMQSKKTAVLLEEIQPDIFQINVGYLNPNEEAKITITYVSELPVEDGKIKLTIPTTIAPRYVSNSDNSDAAKQIAAIPYSTNTPAPLSFNFTGLAQSRVKSIKSPSHDFRIIISDNENETGQFSYSGELSINTTDMDRDIIIYIESHNPEEQNKAIAFLEKPNEQAPDQGYVGMISLVPNFELDEQLAELIFLVDRSGSMSGSSMNQAKKALELFLHSLPSDCYFNIWSFGSTYDALFPEGSMKYSDGSLNKALDHVRKMTADYGGTEIYNPIRDIFFQDMPQNGYLRQVFVLTDGDVSNAPSVISLVRQNSAKGRTFSLGIGFCASRHLVKGIARAGCGTAVFATENEDLRAKVMSQLKNALQPAISNIEIKWGDTSVNEHSIAKEPKKTNNNLSSQRYYSEYMKNLYQQHSDEDSTEEGSDTERNNTSSYIPPIFDGERLLAYHLYPSGASKPSMISMKADTPSGPLTIDIDISENNMIDENGLVRKLAARKKIQELEESKNDNGYEYERRERKEDVKKTIIQLGLENSLTSKYTSFIGVDDKTGDVLFDIPMSRREIKNQIAYGFGDEDFDCDFYDDFSSDGVEFSSDCAIQYCVPPSRSYSISNQYYASSSSSSTCDDLELQNDVQITEKILEPSQDRLMDLINLQKSNGAFEVSVNGWDGSILEKYLGSYSDVYSKCPSGISIHLWITALSMKILELKMGEEKDLWDLVMRKSQIFIRAELNKLKADYEELIDQAEKFVQSK